MIQTVSGAVLSLRSPICSHRLFSSFFSILLSFFLFFNIILIILDKKEAAAWQRKLWNKLYKLKWCNEYLMNFPYLNAKLSRLPSGNNFHSWGILLCFFFFLYFLLHLYAYEQRKTMVYGTVFLWQCLLHKIHPKQTSILWKKSTCNCIFMYFFPN